MGPCSARQSPERLILSATLPISPHFCAEVGPHLGGRHRYLLPLPSPWLPIRRSALLPLLSLKGQHDLADDAAAFHELVGANDFAYGQDGGRRMLQAPLARPTRQIPNAGLPQLPQDQRALDKAHDDVGKE